MLLGELCGIRFNKGEGVCGGAVFGSGTQGLQSRTLSPPPRLSNSEELPARAGSSVGRRVRELGAFDVSLPVGGWTINWYGIVMRCGEQALQTTLPHFLPIAFNICSPSAHISEGEKNKAYLQWCLRTKKPVIL